MRYALGLEYDGAGFFGWQRQSDTASVQLAVEKALGVVANHPVTVICAGRTDTGVHARGQVVRLRTCGIHPGRSRPGPYPCR